MSVLEIYAVRKNGEVELYEEIQNAARAQIVVWNEMERRHLPPFRPDYIPDWVDDELLEQYFAKYLRFTPTRVSSMMPGDLKPVWDLINSEKVSLTEKWALGSTFDKVIVERVAFDDVIEAYETFFEDEEASNLPEQAKVIRQMKEEDDIIGIAWSTSLADYPWLVDQKIPPSHELWEEADEDYDWDGEGEEKFRYLKVPYNIFKEDKHWFLNREEQMNEPSDEVQKENL